MTARDLVIRFIKPYVTRGDTLKSLLDGQGGQGCSEFSVQFGGYAWENEKCIYKAKRDEIIVTRLNNENCLFIYKAQLLFNEIKCGQQTLF